MKRRFLLIAAASALLVVLGVVLLRQREYRRESYGGKHTRDWAWQLMRSQVTGVESNRAGAIAALQALGPRALPPLKRMLQERDAFYDDALVKLARNLPVNQRQTLLRQLRPGQALAQRLAAIQALGVLGTNAVEAAPLLSAALQDPIGQVRWDAARALIAMGDRGVTALTQVATDTNAAIRHAAIFALSEARTNAPLVVPTLFNALLDPDPTVRASAVYAVGRMGQTAVPMLMERLASTNAETQVIAMRALAGVRPPLRLISTNLIAIARTASGELRRQALETIGVLRVNSSNAAALLIEALDDPEPAIRVTASKAVGEIHWRTAAAIPRLTQLAQSAIFGERAAAATALGQFGAQASNAVPVIQLLLGDAEPVVRIAATNALAQIKASAGSRP